MHLPPLQTPSMTHYCVSGRVSVAADATIAAGVVLKADADSAIVIGPGACVGLGAMLHAYQGEITVEAGASLGAGVLVVGHCRIGRQACVGTSTTLYNANVGPGELVPSASLLGDRPRSAASPTVGSTTEKRNVDPDGGFEDPPAKTATMEPEPSPWDMPEPGTAHPANPASPAAPSSQAAASQDNAPAQSSSRAAQPKTPGVVYGKAQFEQMRGAMWPRRQD